MNTNRAMKILRKYIKLIKRMNVNHGDVNESIETVVDTLDCYIEKEKK